METNSGAVKVHESLGMMKLKAGVKVCLRENYDPAEVDKM